jgi:hypothetical protein
MYKCQRKENYAVPLRRKVMLTALQLKKTPPPKKHNGKKGITIPEFEEGKYYIIQFKDGQNKILY